MTDGWNVNLCTRLSFRLTMQQPMNASPVQVVVIAHPGMIDKQINYRNMKTYLARQLIGLGMTQLVIGMFCIIFQCTAVWVFANTQRGIDFFGHGFWNGLMFVITGSFGIAGGIRRNRCQVITFNVLSILSPVFTMCLLGFAIPGAINYTIYQSPCGDNDPRYNNYYYSNYYYCTVIGMLKTGLAMNAMMAILAFIECIIAIWSSAICCTIGACCCDCGGSCCCPPSPIRNQHLMTNQPFPGQQQIIFANQQQSGSIQQPQMFIPNQQPQFLPNFQQLMFSNNPQQPFFAFNPQQPIIYLDPRQHVALYNAQQPDIPSYSEQPSADTSLSPASRNQVSSTGVSNATMDPDQISNSGSTTSLLLDLES